MQQYQQHPLCSPVKPVKAIKDNPFHISGTIMFICIALFIVFLQTLDFSECVIEHIDRKAFGNLGNSIETISLKGNQLRSLQVCMHLEKMHTHGNKRSLNFHLAWEIQLAVCSINVYSCTSQTLDKLPRKKKTFALNYSVQIASIIIQEPLSKFENIILNCRC